MQLDRTSELRIRLFLWRVIVLTMCAAPSLALDGGRAAPFLRLLSSMFSFTSLALALLALRRKWPSKGGSLGAWDEVLALNALSLLCSGLARVVAAAMAP